MNNFEKWWDEYSYWAELKETGIAKDVAKDAYNQGKKAALKWVLSKNVYPRLILEKEIKEELNEISNS